MFKITTVAREYGKDEGHGILIYFKESCLDIMLTRGVSQWYIGKESPNPFGVGYLIRLGRFWIEYTGGVYNGNER